LEIAALESEPDENDNKHDDELQQLDLAEEKIEAPGAKLEKAEKM
jgi:hypothetical protein